MRCVLEWTRSSYLTAPASRQQYGVHNWVQLLKSRLRLLEARQAHSVSPGYHHSAAVSAPAIGPEDTTAHVQALTKLTHQAGSENQQSLSLLDTRAPGRKPSPRVGRPQTSPLPLKEAPAPASQKGVCVFIPDASGNMSSLLSPTEDAGKGCE